jgi:glycerophosphoryl diester phosphodiesterase
VASSFSRAATDAVVAAAPHLRVALLCRELPDPDGLGALGAGGYWGVHPAGARLDAAGVEAIHAAGLAAVAWTVNDAGHAARLAGAGLDAVITDMPLALQQRIGG